ncbi:MAG: hypothetical protein NC548_14310 [Lachnospiraceae bacterium]|nr:hypothetical protein [Lachnospiraceae bacterium]MCM1215675.1 hypothetical protein [Lachnospiraceae bacterium]
MAEVLCIKNWDIRAAWSFSKYKQRMMYRRAAAFADRRGILFVYAVEDILSQLFLLH